MVICVPGDCAEDTETTFRLLRWLGFGSFRVSIHGLLPWLCQLSITIHRHILLHADVEGHPSSSQSSSEVEGAIVE